MPQISPFMMDMAKSLLENMDPETLRDLAESLKPEDMEGGEPPPLPENLPEGFEDMLKDMDPQTLKKLGEAFQDMGGEGQRNETPDLPQEALDALKNLDEGTLQKLSDALPEPKGGRARDEALEKAADDILENVDGETLRKLAESRGSGGARPIGSGLPKTVERLLEGMDEEQLKTLSEAVSESNRGSKGTLDEVRSQNPPLAEALKKAAQDSGIQGEEALKHLLDRVDGETLRALAESRRGQGSPPELPEGAKELLDAKHLDAKQLEELAKAASRAEIADAERSRELLSKLDAKTREGLRKAAPRPSEPQGRVRPPGASQDDPTQREGDDPTPREREITVPEGAPARRVQEVRLQGGRRARVPFGDVPPAVLEEATRSLDQQRVPEGYDRVVRDYFSRWRPKAPDGGK